MSHNHVITAPRSLKGKPSICKKSVEWSDQKPKRRRVGEGSWSRLLKRVFRVDVSRCPRCGGDLEILSAVTDGDGVARYLEHVGMGRDPPRVWGVRAAALVFGEEF